MSARTAGPEGAPRTLRGSARDFAWLYSPRPLRAVLGALLDIEQEIGAALRPALDHGVAHARLAWWREECVRCASGRPAHPSTRALLAAVGGPVDPGGLIATVSWDLAAATFDTRADLAGYCEKWASAMTEIAAGSIPTPQRGVGRCIPEAEQEAQARKQAQRRDPEPDPQQRARFGRSLGAALKEIELLTAIAADAAAGRLRLPLDELQAAGVEPEALARPPWPAPLCRLIQGRHRAARAALGASLAALAPGAQPALRGLLVWAALAHRASTRAERALRGCERADGASASDGAARARGAAGASRIADAWLAWRAARRANRRVFRLKTETAG